MTDSTKRGPRVLVMGRFTSIHTRRFAEELQRQGADVAALYPRESKDRPAVRCYQPSKTPRILGLPKTATFASILYLRSAITEFAPDIIHIQDDPQLAKWLRFVNTRRAKLAYSSWGHYPKKTLAEASFQKSLGKFALIVSDAPDVLAEITPFAPNARQEIVRFGADMKLFSPGVPDSEVLKRYKLNVGTRYLISPRSIRPNYNQLTLIRALPKVLAKFPDAKVIIKHHHVENYSDSEAYELCLQKEADRLNVRDSIIRLNHLPYEDLCHLFRLSRIAISIPLEDGFPATIFEAMAAGCPLVVSRDGSYEGVVEDGINAITIDPQDVTSLSDAVLRILGDEEFATRLRNAGTETVQTKGDFSREISQLLQVYKNLVNM